MNIQGCVKQGYITAEREIFEFDCARPYINRYTARGIQVNIVAAKQVYVSSYTLKTGTPVEGADPILKLMREVSLPEGWAFIQNSSTKKHGQWSSKNKKGDLSCSYTGHSASHY